MIYNEELHMDNLPTVRIKRIVLDDFKSVEHGVVDFNCGRKYIQEGTSSDILGLYGQNGSGKTSLVEALSIIELALSNESVPNAYRKCIAVGKEFAKITVVFDLQYPNSNIREITYSCCIKKEEMDKKESEAQAKAQFNAVGLELKNDSFYYIDNAKVIIFNEKLSMKWESSSKRTLLIDTSSDNYPFTPDTKRKEMIGGKKKTLFDLEVCKQRQRDKSKSFIFSKEFIKAVKENSKNAIFPEILTELKMFATNYLFAIDSEFSRIAETNFALFIPTPEGYVTLKMEGTFIESIDGYNMKKELVQQLSDVINQIIPGLTMEYKLIEKTIAPNGQPAISAKMVSCRDEIEIPLSYESDGIKKLTSILSLIVCAFYQKSTTIAIDEFDSGIFEYMLGEILQAFEEAGKGQFIFTSHNLRPLEVIDKKYIYFTTANPQNRYTRLKGVAESNNLRDMYFRELIMNEQDESLYNRTKKTKLISAMRRVGEKWYE